jgi:hypothetical protein
MIYCFQLVRAARLVVDTSLHTNQMKRDQAIQMLSKYMWEDSDIQVKEVNSIQTVLWGEVIRLLVQWPTYAVKLRDHFPPC